MNYAYQKKFIFVNSGFELRKIHVSPLGEEDDYRGTITRKCKAVTDTDTTYEIFLDDDGNQGNAYEVTSQDIVFNKGLTIRSITNSNINPLVKHISNVGMSILIFREDNTVIKLNQSTGRIFS